MKYENIENEKVKALVQAFYVYQSALIRSPLGQVGVNNQPDFPTYFKKYNGELQLIGTELNKENIEVQKAKLPEEPVYSSPTSFLQDFERQQALKYVLVLEGQVIQPPEQLELMMQAFIAKLSTPWH